MELLRDPYGYYSFLADERHAPRQLLQEGYCELQKTYPVRVYKEFLKPLIAAESARAILDVGCGLGTEVKEAQKDGYDAYGIDLPNMAPYWRKNGNNPSSFFSCSAIRMPFRSNCFDFVWSLGVVEHIGTTSDTATLAADYLQARRGYVNELIRVTKPGGRIVVSCPNRAFPVDLHHGPTCGKRLKQLRWYVFTKTKLNIHKTWGKYHLLSYADINRLFLDSKFVESVSPLPLTSYFGFNNAFRCGYLRHATSLAKSYVEHLPSFLLPTFLNPYVLVMARKEAEQEASPDATKPRR
jgi:SAM-dependent methyltransferase